MEYLNDQLKCVIEDNGVGRSYAMRIKKERTHQSLGLSITSERMEISNEIHTSKMHLQVIDKVDEHGLPAGTRVELFLPIL